MWEERPCDGFQVQGEDLVTTQQITEGFWKKYDLRGIASDMLEEADVDVIGNAPEIPPVHFV